MKQVSCGAGDSGSLMVEGPMLRVRIGFDPDYFLGKNPSPSLPPTDLPALVDTGATYSAIDSALGTYLGLPRVGTTRVSGAHGSGELPLYAAQVYVIDLELHNHRSLRRGASFYRQSKVLGRARPVFSPRLYDDLRRALRTSADSQFTCLD